MASVLDMKTNEDFCYLFKASKTTFLPKYSDAALTYIQKYLNDNPRFNPYKQQLSMYPIVSRLSFLIRFLLCFVTIERLPIFANEDLNWLLGQVLSIYTIFWLICYIAVGEISSRFDMRDATTKSILYFILYLPLIGSYWLILTVLTYFNVLPISIQ